MNEDTNTCDQCLDGYNLIQSTQNNVNQQNLQTICRATCDEYSYQQSDSLVRPYECTSICKQNQIGDDITRTCQILNQCPQLFEVGQQFYSDAISTILLFTNNDTKKVEEIITSSLLDNKILIWNSYNGQLRAKLKGHTSNILKMFILPQDTIDNIHKLLTFSGGGEIIIWHYDHGTQIQDHLVKQGQLTINSEINFNKKLIVSFGFQGEFFLINYETFEYQKYIGHQDIVEQVYFVDNTNLISTSKDKKIILWNINNQDKPVILMYSQVFKISIYPFKYQNTDFYQFIIFILGQDANDFHDFQIGNLSNGKNGIIKEAKQFQLLQDSENKQTVINFIVDDKNNYVITYTTQYIQIYEINVEVDRFQLTLNEKINTNQVLPSNSIIQICILFNDKFIIGNDNGEIIFFKFQIQKQQNESFLKPEIDNIFKVESIQNTSSLQFVYSENDNTLYISHDFILSLNYQQRQINFIIKNWPSPIIRQWGKTIDLDKSEEGQIICSISTDGTAFIYDFITEQLLSIIEHPDNTQQIIYIPVAVTIVKGNNACISYNDGSVICFDPLTTEVNFKFKNETKTENENKNQNYYYLKADHQNNYLIAVGLNFIHIFDLQTNTLFKKYNKLGQFYSVYYSYEGLILYSSTQEGYYIKFNYPDLTIDKEVDYSYLNTNQQKIIGWRIDQQTYMASVTYYDEGLILVFNKDLTLIKQIQQKVTFCGVKYPQYVICVNQTGQAIIWSIYTNYQSSQSGFDYPYKNGRFSANGFFILNIDYLASFGSGILVVDLQYLIAQQTISIEKKIENYLVDDIRVRVLATMTTGEVQSYHFTVEKSTLINWKNSQTELLINKILIIEDSYQILILSSSITLYDYLNKKILKVQQYHDQQVTGSLIDNKRTIIISYNNDKKKNLFVWQYKDDIINELKGHNDSVLEVIMQNNDGNIISYSSDGFIIVWNYLTYEILNKLNLHQQSKVINVIYTQLTISNKIKQLIISQGNNQMVSVYDLKRQEILALFRIKDLNSTMKIDTNYQRIFIYQQNTIYVYNYITGIQISTLLGFDGVIGNFVFSDNYIIATGEYKIFSFDRNTLQLHYQDQFSQTIYQISILDDLVGIISNQTSDNINLWNYKTGVVLQDMINRYYPIPINGILVDKDAKVFLVKNINNQIFSFNPFLSAFSQVSNYMILPIFSKKYIKEILIDYQSNLFFAYNEDQIMVEKYYSQLGSKGQEKIFSSKSVSLTTYNKEKDSIIYCDLEQNVWVINKNSLNYGRKLKSTPKQIFIIGNIMIIRDDVSLKSFNVQYEEISTIKQTFQNIIYSPLELSKIFAIDNHQNIVQILLNQESSEITEQKTYTLEQEGNIRKRIFVYEINYELKHLLISTINGQLIIIDYESKIIFANFENHKKVIRHIIFDNKQQVQQFSIFIFLLQNQYLKLLIRLITSSNDGFVKFYSYDLNKIELTQSLEVGGQIEEMVLDSQNNQLFVWVNLQTQIRVIDLKSQIQIKNILLGPGDVYVQIHLSDQFERIAVYNLFQINIYEKSSLEFISKVRYPSELQDIQDIFFLSQDLIAIRLYSGIRVYKIYLDQPAELISNLPMKGGQIADFNYDENSNQFNIKGINNQYSFNYTSTLSINDDNSDQQNSCFIDIYDSHDYITMRIHLERLDEALNKFNQNQQINQVLYNLIYNLDSQQYQYVDVFYPIFESLLSKESDRQFIYKSQDEDQRVIVNLETAYKDYSLSYLKLQSYSLYISDYDPTSEDQQIKFHPNTNNFIFKDGLVKGSLKNQKVIQGIYFSNITMFQLEKLRFENNQFNGILLPNSDEQLDQIDQNYLLNIDVAKTVIITELSLINCIFKNQNYFLFKNIQNVVIKNLQIKNVIFNKTITENYKFSLFRFSNCQNVTIYNVTIETISSPIVFSVFDLQGNQYINIYQLTASNLSNTQIIAQQQTYIDSKFEHKVRSDEINLSDFDLKHIENQQLSSIQIQTAKIVLKNINTYNILCKQCKGSSLNIKTIKFNLLNSNFLNNTAFEGGSIYLENCLSECFITNSTIQKNKAINGGGIFLHNSELILKQSNIKENQAYIGGGIRYTETIPQQFYKKSLDQYENLIKDNKALVFGNNIGSYPRNIIINFKQKVSKQTQSSNNEFGLIYDVQDFMSGDNLLLEVQLIDEGGDIIKINESEFPQILQDELNQYQIQCTGYDQQIQLNSETLVSLEKYNKTTSSFVFDKLVINSKPLTTNKFFLKTNSIKIPSYQNSKVFMIPDKQVQINLNFRNCQIGEVLVKNSSGSLDYCKKCPQGMYSLIDPTSVENLSCQICPQQATLCQNKTIILKNGYWRESNTTDVIIECINAPQNCIGEDPTNINYCKKGYIGPLCEMCDLFGEVWDEKYSKVEKFECVKCEDKSSFYLLYSFSYIIILLYIFYGIKQSYDISVRKAIGYYLRMMKLGSIGTSDCVDHTSIYLKFFMHYLYISSIIKIKTFEVPEFLEFLQINISSPISQMRFVPDCYRDLIDINLKPVFVRQILSQILPISYILGMGLVLLILTGLKILKLKSSLIINSFVFVFFFLQPDINSSLISISSCRKIGSQDYIIDDVTEKCYTYEHTIFLLSFCLPLFLVWAVIFPSILFYQMFKQKLNLQSVSNRIKYGFLYQEYRLNIFYWEFIKMICRLFITLVDSFFSDYEIMKSVLVCTVIAFYLLFLMRKQPYESIELNRFDKISHIILFIILQINILVRSITINVIQSFAILFFYVIHYSYFGVLVLHILKSQIETLLINLIRIFPQYQSRLNKIKKYLKIQENRFHIYQKWRIIWNHLFITKNIYAHNTENLSKIQQRKSKFVTQKRMTIFSKSNHTISSNTNIKTPVSSPLKKRNKKKEKVKWNELFMNDIQNEQDLDQTDQDEDLNITNDEIIEQKNSQENPSNNNRTNTHQSSDNIIFGSTGTPRSCLFSYNFDSKLKLEIHKTKFSKN